MKLIVKLIMKLIMSRVTPRRDERSHGPVIEERYARFSTTLRRVAKPPAPRAIA